MDAFGIHNILGSSLSKVTASNATCTGQSLMNIKVYIIQFITLFDCVLLRSFMDDSFPPHAGQSCLDHCSAGGALPTPTNTVKFWGKTMNIVCSAVPKLLDPQLELLLRTLRAVKRLLRSLPREGQKQLAQIASRHSGLHTHCRGRLDALKYYLDKLGWNIDANLDVQVAAMFAFLC